MTTQQVKQALRRARRAYPDNRVLAHKLARAYLNPPPSGYLIDGAPGRLRRESILSRGR